jgi:hypothetical protein
MKKTEQQQQFHSEMLAKSRDILEKYNVTAILTNSALLGAFRDGDLISHCPGVVLTTFRSEIKPKEKFIIEDFKRAGFKIAKHFINKNYKLRVEKQGLNVEIVAYSEKGKYYYRKLKKKYKIIPKKLLRPPYTKIRLRGQTYNAPHNIKKFLRFLYEEWTVKLTSKSVPSKYKTKKHMVMK